MKKIKKFKCHTCRQNFRKEEGGWCDTFFYCNEDYNLASIRMKFQNGDKINGFGVTDIENVTREPYS